MVRVESSQIQIYAEASVFKTTWSSMESFAEDGLSMESIWTTKIGKRKSERSSIITSMLMGWFLWKSTISKSRGSMMR